MMERVSACSRGGRCLVPTCRPLRFGELRQGASSAPRLPRGAVVSHFKPSDRIQDWRVQKMVDLAKSYMTDFLSEGRTALAETLFDEAIVHTDPIWDPGNATVGVQGMRAYAEDLRAAFPDLALRIEELASPDTRSLVVLYSGHATGLGPYHAAEKASHRFSALRGAAVMRFDPDRSRIARIEVFRTPFVEDRLELQMRDSLGDGGFRQLRLNRLV